MYIFGWEPEGHKRSSTMFHWEPEGCYRHRFYYSDIALLILNRTSLNYINVLLALNWRCIFFHISIYFESVIRTCSPRSPFSPESPLLPRLPWQILPRTKKTLGLRQGFTLTLLNPQSNPRLHIGMRLFMKGFHNLGKFRLILSYSGGKWDRILMIDGEQNNSNYEGIATIYSQGYKAKIRRNKSSARIFLRIS